MKKTFKHFFCLFVAILCFDQMWATAYTPSADEVIILNDVYSSTATDAGYSSHSAIAWAGTGSTKNDRKCGDPNNGGAATSDNVTCYSVKGNGKGKNITVSITGCSKIIVYHEKQSSRYLRIHSTNESGTVLATSSSSTYYTELTLTPATSYTLFLEGWSTEQADFYVYAVKLIKGSGGGGDEPGDDPEPGTCPTSGTLYSASVKSTVSSAQSFAANSTTEVSSSQADITGGKLYAINGESSAKDLIASSTGYKFCMTNNTTKFKLELDCELAEGDVITIDGIGGTKNSDAKGLWVSSSQDRPSSVPACSGTSTTESLVDDLVNYTVTSSDEYHGKTVLYIHRAVGASTYFNNISITRPAPAPTTKRIYMKCGSTWCDDVDGQAPKFYVYAWSPSDFSTEMTKMCEGNVYYADIPSGIETVLFTRQRAASTGLNWEDNFVNQSEDITLGSNDLFTCTGWNSASPAKATFSAGTYATPSYTISFAGNGSTDGSMTSISSLACGADQAITANAFVKAGYSFANWTADVDVTVGESTITAGNAISDGATLKNISSDITLTAQWTQEVPTSVSVDGTWRCFPGQTITLTATPTGGTSDFTYQWQKYVSTWEDIEGATAATYSKADCAVADARSYRCVVSKAGGNVTSDGYDVHIYTLNGNYNGTAWIANDITLASGTAGKVELTLEAGRLYTFKVKDNFANSWFGNSGYMIKSETGWTCPNNVDADIRLFTAAEGKYVFDVDIAHTNYETPEVTVGVTYPSVSHPAEGYVYFAKGNYTWTNIAAHWWYWDGETATDFVSWANNPWLTQSVDICGTTYYYMPKLEGYNRVIFHNAEGDGQTSDITVDDSSSGKYILGNSTEWTAFATYTISFAGNGNTSGEMSAIAGVCPNANQALTANAFAKTGYNFAGWKADVDVTIGGETVTAGTVIADEATIQNISSNIALTAQWEVNCPTEGTVYSASTSATGNISIAASTVNLELNSSTHKTTVSGGKMYVYNGQSSGKDLITADGFSMTNGNTYFHIQLDCALEEGDVISVKVGKHADARGVWISSTRTDKVPSSAPACALTTTGTGSELKAVTYTVTGSDEYHGKNDFYIYRATSNSTYFNDISITRPAKVAPTFTAPEADLVQVTYTVGDVITALSVTVATGTFPAAEYQWYRNDTKSTEGASSITGANEASYTPSNEEASDYYYYCVASNSKGSATSHYFHVKVNAASAYNATYDKNGHGTAPDNKSDVTNVTLPQMDAVSGWKHTAWTANQAVKISGESVAAGSELEIGAMAFLTANTTFTAVWTATYAISKGSYANGSITIDPTEEMAGETIEIEATANDDYLFSAWTIKKTSDGTDVTSSVSLSGQTTSASFSMPAYAVTVDATFTAIDYCSTFTISTSESGALAVDDVVAGTGDADVKVIGVGEATSLSMSSYGLSFTKSGDAIEVSLPNFMTEGSIICIELYYGGANKGRGLTIKSTDDTKIVDMVYDFTAAGSKKLYYSIKSTDTRLIDSNKFRIARYSNVYLKSIYVSDCGSAAPNYTRSLTAGRFGTICLPNGGTIEGAAIYEIVYKEASQIFFDEVDGGVMIAGRPYIFYPYSGSTELNVYYTDNLNADAGNHNGLYGSYSETVLEPNDGNYILYNNMYYLVNSTASVGANRAYIKLGEVPNQPQAPVPGRRRISMQVQGEQIATGIIDAENAQQPMKVMIDNRLYIIRAGKMYDMTGSKVK